MGRGTCQLTSVPSAHWTLASVHQPAPHPPQRAHCRNQETCTALQVWDLRAGRPSLTIPGPLLCGGTGAAVSPSTHLLATASWRLQDPLQLWDLRTAGLLTNLPLALDGASEPEPAGSSAPATQAPRGLAGSAGSAPGGAGVPGAHMHGLRPYSVVWLARDTLAVGSSGVRHGLRVRCPLLLSAGCGPYRHGVCGTAGH